MCILSGQVLSHLLYDMFYFRMATTRRIRQLPPQLPQLPLSLYFSTNMVMLHIAGTEERRRHRCPAAVSVSPTIDNWYFDILQLLYCATIRLSHLLQGGCRPLSSLLEYDRSVYLLLLLAILFMRCSQFCFNRTQLLLYSVLWDNSCTLSSM